MINTNALRLMTQYRHVLIAAFFVLSGAVWAGDAEYWRAIKTGITAIENSNPKEAERSFRTALIEAKRVGINSPHATAIALRNLGRSLELQGRHPEAETFHLRALSILEKIHGSVHTDVATVLSDLAALYQIQKRYAEAERLYLRSIAIDEKLDEKHLGVATSFSNLANLYETQGRHSEAEPHLQHALAIREEVLGQEHPDVVAGIKDLALFYKENLGKYSDAEQLLLRALAISEKAYGLEHSVVAESLVLLALNYREQARYVDAEQLSRRALVIREKNSGPTSTDVALSLNALASVYMDQGRTTEAELLLRRSLEINESAYGSENIYVAMSLNNLALLHEKQGRYADAEQLLRRSLYVLQKISRLDTSDEAVTLNNLASIYRTQGRYEEAERIYRRSLTIQEKVFGFEHPDVAFTLYDLAFLHQIRGRYADAESLILRSLAIRKKFFGPEHPIYATTLHLLAWLYNTQGRHAEAEGLLRQILAIYEKNLGPEHLNVATTLNNLATTLYRHQGRYADAESLLQRSIAICDSTLNRDNPDRVICFLSLANLYQAQGQSEKALPYARKAMNLLRKNDIRSDSATQSFIRLGEQATNESAFTLLATILQALIVNNSDAVSAIQTEAFDLFQLARASVTGKALAQASIRFTADTPALARKVRAYQDAIARRKQFDKQQIEIVTMPPAQRHPRAEIELRERIATNELEIQRLDTELLRDFPAYRELTNPEPLSLDEAKKLLGSEEALVSWIVLEKETLVFLVRADRAELFKVDANWSRINQLVRVLRDATAIPEAGDLPPFPHMQAQELYQLLFGPIEKHLVGVKHLILVPDGPLQSLSFGMLKIGDGDTADKDTSWLAMRYALTTLPAITSLRALRKYAKPSIDRKPFIGFGDPDLKGDGDGNRGGKIGSIFARGAIADIRAVSEMQPLPDTADELRSIAKSLKAGTDNIYLRGEATEERVKKSTLNNYRVVAFATHGLMAGEFNGIQEPALILTPPPTGSDEDDGVLTASEVAGLKLDADWVILSACNTAASDGTPGASGFTGLSKAFFYAGARTLLVSHWYVDSKAAAGLTSRMFAETEKGATKAEALRRAMMALADDPETAHPAYWAPFVVVGEGAR